MSILIVDDSPDQQALLRSILGKAGHADVLSADSARAAAHVLNLDGNSATQNIDLILMDVLMPDQDGVETCRQIKRCAHLEDIPIIMVTAKADLSNLQEAFAAGAMDFISKPVNSIELLARVASALRFRGLAWARTSAAVSFMRTCLHEAASGVRPVGGAGFDGRLTPPRH